MKKFPVLNVDDASQEIAYNYIVNIGIATDTDLFIRSAIKDANTKSYVWYCR